MRTGADYKESLRDGRDVWALGEGAVADVTTHTRRRPPWWRSTRPGMTATLPPNGRTFSWRRRTGTANGIPWRSPPPRTSDDLRRMGKQISAVHFLTGGNMTHTPGYGELIALGLQNALKRLDNSSEEIEAAEEYLDYVSRSGRFLTYAGGGPLIGTRLRPEESERAALRLVSETADGIVISGKIQMHTSTPFAEDLLISARNDMPPGSGRYLWFIVPVNAPGLRVVSRRAAARHQNPFLSPLSSRFDELDAMVWMQDVFIPRSRVFTGEPPNRNRQQSLVCWMLWHHSYGWLAKAELTLAIAPGAGRSDGPQEQRGDHRAVGRADRQRADRPHLHDGGGTGPGNVGQRPRPAQPAARRRRRHQHP